MNRRKLDCSETVRGIVACSVEFLLFRLCLLVTPSSLSQNIGPLHGQ